MGAITRGALEVWPVVVPTVELLVAGVELLTAVRLLWPHGELPPGNVEIEGAALLALSR